MAETRPTDAPDAGPYEDDLVEPAPPPPAGNRPAVGAREVEGPEAVPANWQGGQGATDFLGLDPDVRPAAEAPAAAAANGASAQPTDSWLFDIERAGEQQSATPAPAPGATPLDAQAGAPPADASAELPAESLTELLDSPEAAADAEAELAPAAGPLPTPRRSAGRRALAAILLLGALGATGWYGWQRFGHIVRVDDPIASLPPPAPQPKPARPKATPPPAPSVPEPAPVASVPPTQAEPADPVAVEPLELPEPTPPLVEPEPAPVVSTPQPLELPRAPQDARRTLRPSDFDPLPGGARRATAEDLKGIWLAAEIPHDAIALPERLRTLNVGRVRVHLAHGEHVEGTLHSVGEGRVWLEFPLGRMSFAASDLLALTRIADPGANAGKAGSQALAGLQRVEVLVHGGVIRGRLIAREGDRVTLATEEGLRVEIDALEVRPAPSGGTRLIGPVAKVSP